MEIVTVLFLLSDGVWVAVQEYQTFQECGEALEYVITGSVPHYNMDGGASLEGFCQTFEKTTNIEREEVI